MPPGSPADRDAYHTPEREPISVPIRKRWREGYTFPPSAFPPDAISQRRAVCATSDRVRRSRSADGAVRPRSRVPRSAAGTPRGGLPWTTVSSTAKSLTPTPAVMSGARSLMRCAEPSFVPSRRPPALRHRLTKRCQSALYRITVRASQARAGASSAAIDCAREASQTTRAGCGSVEARQRRRRWVGGWVSSMLCPRRAETRRSRSYSLSGMESMRAAKRSHSARSAASRVSRSRESPLTWGAVIDSRCRWASTASPINSRSSSVMAAAVEPAQAAPASARYSARREARIVRPSSRTIKPWTTQRGRNTAPVRIRCARIHVPLAGRAPAHEPCLHGDGGPALRALPHLRRLRLVDRFPAC